MGTSAHGSPLCKVGLFCLLAALGGAPDLWAASNAPVKPSNPSAATPASRSPSAQAEHLATQPTYVGTAVCIGCHQTEVNAFMQTMMGKIFLKNARDVEEGRACETCHGPGSIYIKAMAKEMGKEKPAPGHKLPQWGGLGPYGGSPGKEKPKGAHGVPPPGLITFRNDSGETAEQENAVCLKCHERGDRVFWRSSTHAFRGVRCVDCHTIMRKLSPEFQLSAKLVPNPFLILRPETQICLDCHPRKRLQMNMPSHMPIREGLMTCVDCHNPHGGPYPHQLKAARVNDTCYFCHADKRGPFLWVHPPVMINCLNCHAVHGSMQRHLLKLRPPLLCQQCHIGTFHPGTPAGRTTVFAFSRACLNCHARIHGSNSPGGRVFTR